MKDYDKLMSREGFFTVDWIISTMCNYNCSYCAPVLHDNKHKFIDIDVAKRFVDKIFERHGDKKVVFILSGGEPVIWKHLPELMRTIKEKGGYIQLISNGSRSIKWWKQNIKALSLLVLSFHWEFSDPQHIIDVCRVSVDNEVNVKVNVMALKEKFWETYDLAKEIASTVPGTIAEVRPIRKEQGIYIEDYSDEEFAQMQKQIRFGWSKYHQPSYQKTYTDKGDRFLPQESIVRKENCWKGWKCHIGLESLKVLYDGRIFRGNCEYGGVIGNVNDDLILPDEPIVCGVDYCRCVTDIRITKERT